MLTNETPPSRRSEVETPADRQTQSGTPTMLSPEEHKAQATDESNELWLYVASLDVEVAAVSRESFETSHPLCR